MLLTACCVFSCPYVGAMYLLDFGEFKMPDEREVAGSREQLEVVATRNPSHKNWKRASDHLTARPASSASSQPCW